MIYTIINSDGKELYATENIEINEQDYVNWAEDNSYIENLIIEN